VTGPAGAVVEPENAWAGQGAVLLDIGGDVGALVVAMPDSMAGLEVEIRPLDGQHVPGHGHHHDHDHDHDHQHGRDHEQGHAHEHLAHVAVVARPVADGKVPSLVFPELVSGRYELFEKGRPDTVALRVEVAGGAVASAGWPD
jgi:hypothetical protein